MIGPTRKNRKRDFAAPVLVSKSYRIFPAREADEGAVLFEDTGAKCKPGLGHRIIDLGSASNKDFLEWLRDALANGAV